MNVKLTVSACIAILLAAFALTLTQAPSRVVAGTTKLSAILATVNRNSELCQSNERIPANISALRLSLVAYFGARVAVTATSGARSLIAASTRPNWTGTSVTVPVTPLSHAVSRVRLCIEVGPNSQPIYVRGVETGAAATAFSRTGEPLGGRIGVEYLESGHRSWWSSMLAVARHMGLGHALTGTWVVLPIAILMLTLGCLTIWLLLREPPMVDESAGAAPAESPPSRPIPVGSRSFARSRSQQARAKQLRAKAGRRRAPDTAPLELRAMLRYVPTAAWVCATIALLNAVAWSLIVPSFQGKDEVDHFAYVAQLAENNALPKHGPEARANGTYSPEQTRVLTALNYWYTAHAPQTPAISSLAEQRTLTSAVHAGLSTKGPGEAGVATPEPPLYYALQTIPYAFGHGNILAQLQLMRLTGAIFGALTVLFAFLFLRELLPSSPQLATAGALCVALQPQLAFMDGTVSPDSMLYAVSAALLLCLARAFRKGLELRLAVVLGVLIAIGFGTKLNFVGLAFGIFLGLSVLALREMRTGGLEAVRPAAIAAAIGLAPVLIYAFVNALSNDPTLGSVSGGETQIASTSPAHELSYIWQLYLPRLPGMTPYFTGLTTFKDIWFDRSIGLYGWMDTVFPTWVDNLALIPAAAIALLAARELYARRSSVHTHASELAVYIAIAIGLLALIGASSYASNVLGGSAAFGEPRYLVPLIPFLAAIVVLAIRGAGPRWAPIVGSAIVILFLGHDVFSQLQVVARFYG